MASARSATITAYKVDSSEFGSCRLKGINSGSNNFKFYASISAEGTTLNEACGRCIKISCTDSTDKFCKSTSSVIAYVLDVCRGCKVDTIQSSAAVMSSLAVTSSSSAQATVSYKFVACPSEFLSGDIKACLMEGASSSYIPLQVHNSRQIIKEATISKRKATLSKDSFLISVTPEQQQGGSNNWYKNVDVSMLGENGQNLTTRFSFNSNSGCATSNAQFSEDSFVAEGSDNTSGESGGGSHVGAIIGAVIGSFVALLLIAAVIFFLRRWRRTSLTKGDQELGESAAQNVASRVIPTRGTTGSIDDSAINSPHGGIYSHASTPGAKVNVVPTLPHTGSTQSSRYFLNSSQSSAKSHATNSENGIKLEELTVAYEQEEDRDITQVDENDGKPPVQSSPVRESQFRQSLYDTNQSYDSMAYHSSNLYGSNLSSPRQSVNIAHPIQVDQGVGLEIRDSDNEDRSSFDIDFARQAGSAEELREEDFLDIQAAEIIAYNQSGTTPQAFSFEESTNITNSPLREATEFPWTNETDTSNRNGNPKTYAHSEASSNPNASDNATSVYELRNPSNDIVASPSHKLDGGESHHQSSTVPASFDMVHNQPCESFDRPSDFSRSQTNALNSSGGYKRESLNLLGYPYAKRNSSRKHQPFSG
uniref:Uncharacterized protein AlNc14C360G10984 n=1 Tax=Albugo laibachii Nc14 TaxID=890382 RepID=F0WXP9_9STRA|nr:conserved hypothetical protein [Albugo laibachii Nc14]|eukprot:CCA26244.1 conserved hypothetical protein [Albugo laibachii Nc14]